LFLSAQRIDDLGALAALLFSLVFLMSGLMTLAVATLRYRQQRT
jgi:Mn2+/Fe2+ NRAMP family transporter